MRTSVYGKESMIYMHMASELASRIRSARTARKMSLAKLAGSAGISVSYLSELEHGKVLPSIITYARLCEILEIPCTVPYPGELNADSQTPED